MSLSEIFGNLTRMVRQNGGIWGSLRTLYRTDDLKDGDFVGTDRNGNRYYQNKRFFLGQIINGHNKLFYSMSPEK